MNPDQPCPCTSGLAYAACCGRFLEGNAFPGTALELMRSRYSAYALVRVPYLVETLTLQQRPLHPPGQIERFARESDWCRLDILATDKGKAGDTQGMVEFQAWYLNGKRLECLRERSLFFLEDGKWRYSHGSHGKPQIGRNDPCPCGSGKKYKKCHG